MINPKGRLPDDEFLARFLTDYSTLEKIGWSKHQILTALCTTQQYIRDWVNTPNWLEAVDRLPKGARWTDGMKWQSKGGKKSQSETYILLPINGDMYFKDLLNNRTFYANVDADGNIVPKGDATAKDKKLFHVKDNTVCVIRDFLQIASMEVVSGLRRGGIMTPLLETAVLEGWKRNGGRIWTVNNGSE